MIYIFKNRVKINVKGRNVNRFIRRLIKNNIEILSLNYISKGEANIIIYEKDLEVIEKIKSIYELSVISVYGFLKLKKIIMFNMHIIVLCVVGFALFKMLTSMIFSIEVVHSNKEVRTTIMNELEKEGITKYSLKKDYNTLKKIKENILNRHKKDIEWLEIEEEGTKYIVRVEERSIPDTSVDETPRNIIAKKDAVVRRVISSKGQILKNTNDYVNKGDTIISGEVTLNDKVMGKVHASGKVYGEVWYVVHTKYPFAYYSEEETGNYKNSYVVKFLNHDIELSLNRYKYKKTKDKIIYKNEYIPLAISLQNQKEIKIKSDILTFDEAKEKAQNLAIKKINNALNKGEHIISHKYLRSSVKDGVIEVEMFFAVYENITDYSAITNTTPE